MRATEVMTGVLVLVTAGAVGHASRSAGREEKARLEAQWAQSRLLANLSTSEASPRVAALLALEALPVEGERPLVPEALRALRSVSARLPRASLSHASDVVSAAFSVDGRLVVTAARDGAACVWARASATRLRCVQHAQLVGAELSADGARLVTASEDHTAVVWDVATGARLQTLQHPGTVSSAVFSPDGTRVLTTTYDQQTRLWGAASGELVGTFAGSQPSFSAEGDLLLTAQPDGLTVSDARTGAQRSSLTHRSLRFAAFGPRARVLTVSSDSTALWSLETGARLAEFRHAGDPLGATFLPGGEARVLVRALDGQTTLFDVETGTVATRLTHELRPRPQWGAFFFSVTGARGATVSARTVDEWDLDTGLHLGSFEHEGEVRLAAFSPDEEEVLTVSGREVFLWSATRGQRVASFPGQVEAFMSPDGTRVVSAASDCGVTLWDASTGARLGSLRDEQLTRTGSMVMWKSAHGLSATLAALQDVRFTREGARVLTPTGLWDLPSGRRLVSLENGRFSDDGELVIAAERGEVSVWEVASGAQRASIQHRGALLAATASRVLLSTDGAATLWDLTTGSRLKLQDADTAVVGRSAPDHASSGLEIIRGSKDEVPRRPEIVSGAFSPDGARVLTVSDDEMVAVWVTATGQRLSRFPLGGAASFSPDGAVVLSSRGSAEARDAATGNVLAKYPGSDAHFSPEGTRVITQGRDTELWSTAGEHLASLPHREDTCDARTSTAPQSAAFGAERVLLASRFAATLWDLRSATRVALWSLRGELRPVMSRDGTRVLLPSHDGVEVRALPSAEDERASITTVRAHVARLGWTLTADERARFCPPSQN